MPMTSKSSPNELQGKACRVRRELLSIPSETSYRFRRFRSATDTTTDDYRARFKRKKKKKEKENNDAWKIEVSFWFFTQPV